MHIHHIGLAQDPPFRPQVLCRCCSGDGAHLLDYDSDEVDKQYEVMTLHIIHRRRCTGFEESKDFPVRHNDVIAGRYRVRAQQPHDERRAARRVSHFIHNPEDELCCGERDAPLPEHACIARQLVHGRW